MRTRPADLPDSVVADALRSGWGLEPVSVGYLAVGFGSHHWRADVDGAAWFVTVDDLTARSDLAADPPGVVRRLRAALATARAIHENGAAFVVAPIPTVGGDLVRRMGDRYAAAVYPYVDGRRHAYGEVLGAAERRSILEMVAALHATPEPIRAEALVDDMEIPQRKGLREALDRPGSRWDTGPYGEPARLLLADRAQDVARLLDRHDRVATQARGRRERMVLTHGEPHPGNLIETESGWRLVDWDTTLIAPPERDLWVVDSGDGSITAAYEAATGRPVLASVLELYRLTWQLADIALYVAELRHPHDDTEDIRESWTALRHALQHLLQ
jgi:spectinomycin phosphotransferase/16S rRNA (guanine(1405)-N(7))-methyltransferase